MNGLYRGEGVEFQAYGPKDGLPDATIQSLALDSRGRLWVATREGLVVRQDSRFHPVNLGRRVRVFGRSALSPSGDAMYVATDSGLFRISGHPGAFRFAQVSAPPFLSPTQSTDAVLVTPAGTLWASSAGRLIRLSGSHAEAFDQAAGVPNSRWDAILLDSNQDLYARSSSHLLVRRKTSLRFQSLSSGLAQSGFFGALATDRAGQLLVPTDSGLAVRADSGWRTIGSQQGLPSETVSCAFHDREGSLWLGLWGVGLVRLLGYGVAESFTSGSGLPSSTISSITRDPAGVMWMGTDSGIARLSGGPGRWSVSHLTAGLAGTKIRALISSSDGALWAGSFPGGLARLAPGAARFQSFPSEPFNRVNGLHIDSSGRLWIGALEGLFRTSGPASAPPRFERLSPPSAEPHEGYFRMSPGASGAVWIASSAGLLRWKDDAWTRYTVSDGLLSSGLTQLTEDSSGCVWVAYREPFGVTRLCFPQGSSKPAVSHFRDNLASKMILLLRTDLSGRVWIGGDDGFDVFQDGLWSRFSQASGLAGYSCAVDSFFAHPDGSIWAGTARGVTRIYNTAEALRPAGGTLGIAATWLQLGDAEFEAPPFRISDRKSGRGSFAARLAALTFRNRRNIRFRYRLVGLHDSWVETSEREVRYPQLDPGDYVFEATAVTPIGFSRVERIQIPFRILPAFWQTLWFRALIALSLVAALRGLWLWRSRLLQVQRDDLEKAVLERTSELEIERARASAEKEKADEANRCKSDFLARMSHEIRTPMHGVVGITELLLHGDPRRDQREMLGVLKSCANSLMSLLNDILDLSRVEAGRIELKHDAFDPLALTSAVADLMRPPATGKGLSLSLQVDPGVPAATVGDPGRIHQVLVNLISNAIKFTNSGQISVRVSASPHHLTPALIFSVTDTGMGIPQDRLSDLFSPFVQLAPPDTATEGSGLGLAISKRLVEAMDGSISVRSKLGQGSTFEFRVPLRLPPAGSRPPAHSADQPAAAMGSRPLRILVAEDNAVNQRIVVRMLETLGHQCDVVADGLAALSRVSQSSYDAVFMDVQMPAMNGLEAARRIRAQQTTASVPIVGLTANAFEADRQACFDAGMNDFLTKPLHLNELDLCLRRIAPPPPGQPVPSS